MCADLILEAVHRIILERLVFLIEQVTSHGIVSVDELDDERGLERRKEFHHIGKRNVSTDDQVMDHGERENEIWFHAIQQRAPLGTVPTETRRRVHGVPDQGENIPGCAL